MVSPHLLLLLAFLGAGDRGLPGVISFSLLGPGELRCRASGTLFLAPGWAAEFHPLGEALLSGGESGNPVLQGSGERQLEEIPGFP